MAATVGSRRERTTAAKVSRQQYEQLGKPSEDDIRILPGRFMDDLGGLVNLHKRH